MKIIGTGYVAPEGLQVRGLPTSWETVSDPSLFLKDLKSLKLMSKQDRMALIAAGRAVADAEISKEDLCNRTGVYLCVGVLPFEQDQMDLLAKKSSENDVFQMKKFSIDAFGALNPLLTFRCLPNMPLFHISFNLGIQQTYFITYPGPGQWFQALERARQDLNSGLVDYALVGAVADRRNPLVRQYADKFGEPNAPDHLIDSACVWVLTNNESKKTKAQIIDLKISYEKRDFLSSPPEKNKMTTKLSVNAGPVDPSLFLTLQMEGKDSQKTIACSGHFFDGLLAEVSLERTT
jgi:hypothetical protein